MPKRGKLLLGGRLDGIHRSVEQQLEAGVVLDLLGRDTVL